MLELGFMSKEEYENTCAELKRGVYGCVEAAVLWFMRFSNMY